MLGLWTYSESGTVKAAFGGQKKETSPFDFRKLTVKLGVVMVGREKNGPR